MKAMKNNNVFLLKMGLATMLIINSFVGCSQNLNVTDKPDAEKKESSVREERTGSRRIYLFWRINIIFRFQNIAKSESSPKFVIDLMNDMRSKTLRLRKRQIL